MYEKNLTKSIVLSLILSCIGSGVGFTEPSITPTEGETITGTHNFDSGVVGINGYVNFNVANATLTGNNTAIALHTAGKTVNITGTTITNTAKNAIYITKGNMNLTNSTITAGQGIEALNGASIVVEGMTITTVAQGNVLSNGVYIHHANANIIFNGKNTVNTSAGTGGRAEAVLLQNYARATNNGVLTLTTGGECGMEINTGSLFTNGASGTLTINKNKGEAVGPYGIYVKPNNNAQTGFIAASGSTTNINLNDNVANQVGLGVFDATGFAILDGNLNIISTSSNATPTPEIPEAIGIYQNNGSTITGSGKTTIDMQGTTGSGIRMEGAATSANYGELIITAAGETRGANIAGSTFTVNKGKITTDKGNALNIMDGATANLSNIAIESTSTDTGSLGTTGKGNGIAVQGSSVNLSGVNSITTNSSYAPGINLDAASTLNVTSGTLDITTNGVGGGVENSASGLNILNGSVANLAAGSTTNLTTTSDNMTNASADGICLVGTGSTLNSNGILNITTAGNMAEGIEAAGAGVVTNLNGTTTINTAKAIGTLINNNSVLNFNGTTTINTAKATGAVIENASTLNLNGNTHVNAAGHGIQATSNAQIVAGTQGHTTVNLSGDNMYGIYLSDNNATFTDAASSITNINLAGSKQNGFRVENEATGIISGSLHIQEAAGATNSTGIAVEGTTGVAALTNTGTTTISLTNGGGIGVNVSGNQAIATLGETTIVADTALQVGNGGKLDVNTTGGKEIKLTGDLLGSGTGSSLMNVNLDTANSFLTGSTYNDADTINLKVQDNAKWNVTKDSNLSSLYLANGGFVNMHHTGAGNYETITTDSLNGSNGTIKFTTDLQASKDSFNVNNSSDKLIITGTSSGSQKIEIEDASLITSQKASGYLLLVEDRTSGGASFVGEALETGGIFRYTPVITDINPNDNIGKVEDAEKYTGYNSSNAKNWYLTGFKVDEEEPFQPSVKPNLGSSAERYLNYWREIDNLLLRLGELRDNPNDSGIWARIKHGQEEINNIGLTDGKYTMFQIGYDHLYKSNEHGKKYYGIAFDHIAAQQNYAVDAQGESGINSLSLYHTWLGQKGHYLDFVSKAGRMGRDFSYHGNFPDSASSKNWYYSFSTEYGRKIQKGNGYYIEPQTQLILGRINSSSYITNTQHIKVTNDAVNSAIWRVGSTFGRHFGKGDTPSNAYAKVFWNREFGGNLGLHLNDGVDAYDTTENYGGSWWTVGLGCNAQIDKKTNGYLDLEKTFGGSVTTKWQINAGLRWEF